MDSEFHISLDLHGHIQGKDFAVVGIPIHIEVRTNLCANTRIQMHAFNHKSPLNNESFAVVGDTCVGNAFTVTMCNSSYDMGTDIRFLFVAGTHRVMSHPFCVLTRAPRIIDFIDPVLSNANVQDQTLVVQHLKLLQLMLHELIEVVAKGISVTDGVARR